MASYSFLSIIREICKNYGYSDFYKGAYGRGQEF